MPNRKRKARGADAHTRARNEASRERSRRCGVTRIEYKEKNEISIKENRYKRERRKRWVPSSGSGEGMTSLNRNLKVVTRRRPAARVRTTTN